MTFSVAGNSLLGVKESLFPGKWGSASLKRCLSLLWFLRPKKKKKSPKNKFLPPRISRSADLGKKRLDFFFSF